MADNGYVRYYPPDYAKRGWSPEKLPADLVRMLAGGFARAENAGLLNQTARKHFLANALVEGRWDFGKDEIAKRSRTGDSYKLRQTPNGWEFDYSGRYETPVARNVQKMGYPTSYYHKSDPNLFPGDNQIMARTVGLNSLPHPGIEYAALWADKTGRYADAIYGAEATPGQRIALWNGRGRKFDPINTRNNMYADANNHARKVAEMTAFLSDPSNAEILQLFASAVADSTKAIK